MVHVHQGFPMVCNSTNIVYSTSGNWVLQLLATLTKLLLQVTRVERSWEKSAKICQKTFKFWNRDSLWKFTENDTPWKHHLPKVCPHIQECPYVVSCLLVTPSSQSKFFMLSMTALLLSETVMLLHIRIQCKQKLVHGIIRRSKIDSMYSKTSFL